MYPEFRGRSYSKSLLGAADELILEEPSFRKEKIENDNFHNLVRYLKDVLTKKVPLDRKKLEELVLEQKRWQKIVKDQYINHPQLTPKVGYHDKTDISTVISIVVSLMKNEDDLTYDAFMKGYELEYIIQEYLGDIGPLVTGMDLERKDNKYSF